MTGISTLNSSAYQFQFPQMNVMDTVMGSPIQSYQGMSGPDVSSLTAPLPSVGSGGGFMKGFGMDDARLALNGLQTIGNLWGAFQAMKLAKEQFKYTKGVTDTNLNNQIKTYNTSLADRAASRAVMQGQSQNDANAYVEQNKLTRAY